MLDVDCRVDVDAAIEQFLDIEVALGMTAARRIGMGQFVDQRDLRAARDDGVEIDLLERLPLVVEPLAGKISSPSSSACVSLRPCVSTTPTTIS